MALASLIGFAIGILGTYLFVRYVSGGWLYTVLKAGYENHPGAEGVISDWAYQACYAHAFLLDAAGYNRSAGYLMLLAKEAEALPMRHLILKGMDRKKLDKRYQRYRDQGNASFKIRNRSSSISCTKHGDSIWIGHIQCHQCARAYAPLNNEAPSTCECGYRLVSSINDDKVLLPTSGNAMCRHCYADEKKAAVRVTRTVSSPNPEEQARPLHFLPDSHLWGQCSACLSELHLHFGAIITEGGSIPDVESPPERCPVCGHKGKEVEGQGEQASQVDQVAVAEGRAVIQGPSAPSAG